MARSSKTWDEAKIERLFAKGAGSGRGSDYLPWLTVRRVSSIGRSNRPFGRTTGRVHQLLSDIEQRTFLTYDWAQNVTDIREQFPLDRGTTKRIAAEIGVRHPTYRGGSVPVVMTTDFLLDVQLDGRPELAARAVKEASALDDKRTREKLEIERRVWLEQGIDWRVVTEQDLPPVLIDNLEWLHGPWADDTWTAEETAAVIALTEALPQFCHEPLRIFCAAMEVELSLQSGAVLSLFRRLLATRKWQADLSRPLWDAEMRMSQISLPDSDEGRALA